MELTAMKKHPVIAETSIKVLVRFTAEEHVASATKLINKEHDSTGAVLRVTDDEVKSWVKSGLSMVATSNDKVVGHQAVYVWPESGWAEFRSAVVLPEFRGHNLNFVLKKAFIDNFMATRPDVKTFVALKNGASTGKAILKELGFQETTTDKVPKELFTLEGGENWNVLRLDISQYKSSLRA